MALAPATLGEGILGVEATMRWRTDTPYEFNKDRDRSIAAVFPRVVVDRITGLHGLAERNSPSEDRRGAMGEVAYPGYARGRTIVYEGRIQAKNLVDLRIATNQMRAAFNDMLHEEDDMYHVPPVARGGWYFQYKARPLDFQADDDQVATLTAVPSVFQRDFMLTMRATDPRYLGAPAAIYTGKANNATLVVTNLGNAPADPDFTLHGPLTNDITMKIVGGPKVRLQGDDLLDVDAGAFMSVIFRQRVAVVGAHDGNYLRLMTFGSDWFDDGQAGLLPGVAHTIQVSGVASWDFSFRHTSW